ncbi:MAG TPA: OmpA family protein [Kofleriaceae bacterium]|nr:OmpA family protein [Kofleriaceae bacterium]
MLRSLAPAVAPAVLAALIGCGGSKTPPADPRVATLEKELADTKAALAKEKQEADELRANDAALKAKADESKALQDKLAEAVGKAGEVTTADGAVKLELVDQILFPTGEADLTESGREVLAKVGKALKEIDDKQIWVQGHTDDQPIVVRKPKAEPAKPEPAKPDPKAPKGGKAVPKDAKAAPKDASGKDAKKPDKPGEGPDAVLAFVTNWELSAARALTVVHYLQDESKVDPTRLAAVAFSQYRPISKLRAKNRRIEIVLYPRAKFAPK